MSESKARELFFPYLYGEETLQLSLVKCEIDGRAVEPDWNPDLLECDLSSNKDWTKANLRLDVKRGAGAMWLPELVPAVEKSRPPVRLVGTTHCPGTYRRTRSDGTLDVVGERGQIDFELNRSDIVGFVEVSVFVVRDAKQERDSAFASDTAARLIASRRLKIRIDSVDRRPGPGLPIQWESFRNSAHPYRGKHSEVLFHLDTASGEPILFLNKDSDPDLQVILATDAPRGRKAALRNVLFSSIAMPVWNSLVRVALNEVAEDESVAAGWQRNVLLAVASVAYPDFDETEALLRLIRDLRDTAGGFAIEERLPVVISKLAQFREKAEQATRVML